MSRPPAANRVPTKDMYWFAHGGLESSNDKCLNQRSTTPGECEEECSEVNLLTLRSLPDRRGLPDDQKSPLSLNSVVDSGNSSGPSSLEIKDERSRNLDKRIAVEERRKQLLEAEQERNDAVLRKHMEREAALEARRNASRSNISFAFGSSVPRNVDSLQGGDSEKINRHSNNASGLLQKGDDIMSKSMTAAVPAPRGRRKNDLMPTVPYDRTALPKTTSSCSTRKRSVSMTRLDQLAQPRRHYVEANKANSTSSGASSMLKDNIKSPTRPLSSASEQSGGSGRVGSSATRRVRSSPRKPRPVSIAGTVPDNKFQFDKLSPVKKSTVATKKPQNEVKKTSPISSKPSSSKSIEKSKPAEKTKPPPRVASAPKPAKLTSTPKPTKQPPPPKASSPKVSTAKKAVTNKKKADIMISQSPTDVSANQSLDSTKTASPSVSPPPESAVTEAERNAKHIISEEEAKAALAEKRRLAREQAEKEAELERQRQEELRLQEEEKLRLEEEEQRRMEEEQLRLLEEHRKQEEEKLKKAIEENERREEEERSKREEEQRLKAEQEKKAQEEAEKQRIELEEKLRKEEEERAERKKRLEKIMSRTRGKTSGSSPSGSVSGSEQLDSSENQQENLSSGANSLDSTGTGEIASGPTSLEAHQGKSEPVSDGASMEANPTYEVASDNESLHDIVMPKSETASQDNSLVIIPEKDDLKASVTDSVVESQLNDAGIPLSEIPQSEAENTSSNVELSDGTLTVQATEAPIDNVSEALAASASTEISAVDALQETSTVDALQETSSVDALQETSTVDALQETSTVGATAEAPVVDTYEELSAFDTSAEVPVVNTHEEPSAFNAAAEASYVNVSEETFAVSVSEETTLANISQAFESEPCEPVEKNLSELTDSTNLNADVADETKMAIEENYDAMFSRDEDSENVEEIIESVSAHLVEMPVTVATDSETPVVDHTEVILTFEGANDAVETSVHESADMLPALLPDAFQPSETCVSEQAVPEEVETEQSMHFSTSSDIKLPDPIYETSDDGSVSSEKNQQDCSNFELQEEDHHHQESQPFSDEVFNEREVLYSEESNYNPFEKNADSSASNTIAAFESQFEVAGMQDSIYAYETSDAAPAVVEQPREIEEENVYPSRSSTSSLPETTNEDLIVSKVTEAAFPDIDDNKENVESEVHETNPFGSNIHNENDYSVLSNKENMQFSSENVIFEDTSVYKTDVLPENLEIKEIQAQDSTSNVFIQQESVTPEQINFENQTILSESSTVPDSFEFSDVTIIKAEGSNDCIGIISSIDHDHISSDLAKQSMQNEQLKSNFEYSSITDSEDSSLDSNLSQVMTVEVSEKNTVGLNNVENISSESTLLNNVQATNPFSETPVNGTSDSKSNGDHYSEADVLSNGHRLESSDPNMEQIGDYVQLDGKHISSVDHSKTNIFDNVDAVDFGKMSPDPFLAKGSSNQISGNPFLLQDDQKQVLMTPDFFN